MIDQMLQRTTGVVTAIAVRAGRLAVPRRRRNLKPPAYHLILRSRDKMRIASTFWPSTRPGSPGLLIIHGLGASRRAIQPNAEWFAAQGYAVLTIDLRGHGGSSPSLHSLGWHEAKDAHAAFDWLKQTQGGAKVAVIGISMGGAATLLGASGPVAADALVLQAVFADLPSAIRSRIALIAGQRFAGRYTPLLAAQSLTRFGIPVSRVAPITVVPDLKCPLLVIGGGKDRFTSPKETAALYERAQAPKWLFVMPGVGHRGVCNTFHRSYRERVLTFLHETIGRPASADPS